MISSTVRGRLEAIASSAALGAKVEAAISAPGANLRAHSARSESISRCSRCVESRGRFLARPLRLVHARRSRDRLLESR